MTLPVAGGRISVISSSLRVSSYAFTVYPVLEPTRARALDEGVLGPKSTAVWREGEHFWMECDLGGHTLAIAQGPPKWVPAKQGPSLAMEVDDFDAAIGALRAAGAPFQMDPRSTRRCAAWG